MLYPTVAVGAVLSILAIDTATVAVFPAISFIVTFSLAFDVYVFVNTFPFDDFVQPLTSCTASFAVIVAITLPFVAVVIL